MNTLKFALLSLMMVIQMTGNVVTTAAIRNEKIAERISLIAAVNKSMNFWCKKPQPRSYHVEDLFPSIKSAEISKPVYIVVMRCDTHSGCCANRYHSCLPDLVGYQEIEVEFREVQNALTIRRIRVEEHRTCKCVEHSYRMESVVKRPNVTFVE